MIHADITTTGLFMKKFKPIFSLIHTLLQLGLCTIIISIGFRYGKEYVLSEYSSLLLLLSIDTVITVIVILIIIHRRTRKKKSFL